MWFQEICLRESDVVLCGGSESMSQAPYAVRNIRFGTKFGFDLKVCFVFGHCPLYYLHSVYDGAPAALSNHMCYILSWQLEDTLWAGLTDLHIKTPMGITAENLAEKYEITREDCDNYAYQTQQRWKAGKTGPCVCYDKRHAFFQWLIGTFIWFYSSWGWLLYSRNRSCGCEGQERQSGYGSWWAPPSTDHTGADGQIGSRLQKRRHSHCCQCFSEFTVDSDLTRLFLLAIIFQENSLVVCMCVCLHWWYLSFFVFILQGVSDGAAAVVIASEDAVKEHKLSPLARIVAYHVSGCDPSIMGIGEWQWFNVDWIK